MARERLSRAQARRVTIAAQGLAARRPMTPGLRQVTTTVDRIGLLQIDSVNVVTRAHYLPLFSRLGAYDRTVLDRAGSKAPRRFVEYWAHVASLVPAHTHPLLRFRMKRWQDEAWPSMRRIADEQPGLVTAVHDEVRAGGPMTSQEVEVALEHDLPRQRDQWGWNWSLVKESLEYLFFSGQVGVAERTAQFERRYDVIERVLPPAVHDTPTPSEPDAFRALTLIAARAHGVASEPCLRDYFRLRPQESQRAVAELVESGDLLPVEVEGWRRPTYLHRQARLPRAVDACALLAPFDPLVWRRERAEVLFDFHYRIEIYTPANKRRYGYYVLPFLLGDALAARVDVKSDRAAGVLRVLGAYAEPDPPPDLAPRLADELARLATWLGLSDVVVGRRGDLARSLAAAVSR